MSGKEYLYKKQKITGNSVFEIRQNSVFPEFWKLPFGFRIWGAKFGSRFEYSAIRSEPYWIAYKHRKSEKQEILLNICTILPFARPSRQPLLCAFGLLFIKTRTVSFLEFFKFFRWTQNFPRYIVLVRVISCVKPCRLFVCLSFAWLVCQWFYQRKLVSLIIAHRIFFPFDWLCVCKIGYLSVLHFVCVCLSLNLSVCQSVCLSNMEMTVCLAIGLSVHWSIQRVKV